MAIINFNLAQRPGKYGCSLLLLSAALTLTGCGLTQTVSDGTVAMTKSIFYKQIKILHLDFKAREALNQDDNGTSLSTVIRIYQLKNASNFETADYQSLFASDDNVLSSDLLAQQDIRLLPGGAYSLDMPMNKETQFIGIAAMFNTPDQINNSWRLVIPKEALEPDKARTLELMDQTLTLLPLKD